MEIEGFFTNDRTQVIHHTFPVFQKKSIHIEILEGVFEHILIIVKDPSHKIRAVLTFKSRIKSNVITAGERESSNSTVPGILENGIWSLDIVRTYQVSGDYKIAINFDMGTYSSESFNPMAQKMEIIKDRRIGWFKGDLHMHSYYTDGRVSFEEIDKACKSQNLDFIAVTDHSIFTTKYLECSYLVIPGTEITWDDSGHYNCWGLNQFIDYGYYLNKGKDFDSSLDLMFSDLSSKDLILSQNHPFPFGWSLNHNFSLSNIDTIEVINAPHLFPGEVDNKKAICLFDYLWQNHILLYAVGGSDAHKKNYFDEYPIGIPTTKVYCEGLSVRNLLNGIKRGNSFIECNMDFEINYKTGKKFKDTVLPGDLISGEVLIQARAKQKVTWRIIKNGKIFLSKESKFISEKIVVKKDEYYRLQADVEDEIVLFVNPIHNIEHSNKNVMFQDILKQFYKVVDSWHT